MSFQKIGRVDEIPPGRTKFYCVDGRPLLLAAQADQIFALNGLCPHRLNPLEGAQLWDFFVDCPWHHFMYDIRTGENHFPKNVYPTDYPALQKQVKPLKTYPVELRGPEIWVDLE